MVGRPKNITAVPIVVLGLSHRTAPPEARDRHAFPPERMTEALGALRDYSAVREAIIVSTCNRLEIYADVSDYEVGVAEIKDFLTTYRNMRVDDFDKYLYTMLGAQAVEQLFRVASGLDSMLIGEAEIIGQVKDAFLAAERAGSVRTHLGRLFRMALETGKRARTETKIGHEVVSLGAAAVELASRHCDVSRSRALVIGAGKMATIVAKHLAARGADTLSIANRTLARAQRLAAQLRASATDLGALPHLLDVVDLIIVATGGEGPMLSMEVFRAALARRMDRGFLVVDISVPRATEPGVERLPGIRLYLLDDLRQIVDATLHGRRAEIPAVESIVSSAVREYVRWYQSRAAAPLIASLRRRADEIRTAEVAKLFARLPELDARQRETIEAASVSIINKLLHAPVTMLRERMAEASAPEEATGTQELFDLAGLEQRLARQLAETQPPR